MSDGVVGEKHGLCDPCVVSKVLFLSLQRLSLSFSLSLSLSVSPSLQPLSVFLSPSLPPSSAPVDVPVYIYLSTYLSLQFSVAPAVAISPQNDITHKYTDHRSEPLFTSICDFFLLELVFQIVPIAMGYFYYIFYIDVKDVCLKTEGKKY